MFTLGETQSKDYHTKNCNNRSVAWSPDGDHIAIGDGKDIAILNIKYNERTSTYDKQKGGQVMKIAWSPNGKYIASIHSSYLVTYDSGYSAATLIWNTNTGEIINSLQNSDSTHDIAWSPTSNYIALATDYGIQVLKANEDQLMYSIEGNKKVNTIAWSPDGKYIASGGEDNKVRVWNAANGNPVLTYAEHSSSITSVSWSSDSKDIASASADGSIQIWQAIA
jgi:WD40 repeat protein